MYSSKASNWFNQSLPAAKDGSADLLQRRTTHPDHHADAGDDDHRDHHGGGDGGDHGSAGLPQHMSVDHHLGADEDDHHDHCEGGGDGCGDDDHDNYGGDHQIDLIKDAKIK